MTIYKTGDNIAAKNH